MMTVVELMMRTCLECRLVNQLIKQRSLCRRCPWSETFRTARSESTRTLVASAGHCSLWRTRSCCWRRVTFSSWRRESTTTTGRKWVFRVHINWLFPVFYWFRSVCVCIYICRYIHMGGGGGGGMSNWSDIPAVWQVLKKLNKKHTQRCACVCSRWGMEQGVC